MFRSRFDARSIPRVAPLCLIGSDPAERERLVDAFRSGESGADSDSDPGERDAPGVERIAPDAVPGGLPAVAAAVAVLPSAHCGDATRLESLVDAVVDAGAGGPVVVGGTVDAGVAYDAGASEVVPLEVAGNAERVADRLRAVADRRRERRVGSDLLDATGDGVVVHDPETGAVVACDERFYATLGYDPTTDDVGLAELTGGDAPLERERVVSRVRAAADGATPTVEWTVPTSDGGRERLSVRFEAADLAGERYVVASVEDGRDRAGGDEPRDGRETLARLHDITADPDASVDEQIRRLLEFGVDRLGMDVGVLSRTDAGDGVFEVVEARGAIDSLDPGTELDLSETYCRRTVASDTETPLAVRAAAADHPAAAALGLRCYLGVELVVDGHTYGTLCFAGTDARSRPFSDAERALVDHMAQWVGQELEREAYVEELEAARTRLERTFERVDDAVFAVDEDWQVRYVNDAGAEVLREAMDVDAGDDLLGRRLWAEIPDAVETPFYEEYHRAMREQESITFEAQYEPLDVWFEVRAYPDEDGLSVYFTDVTDRKERQFELERYETILESIDDAVYAIDPDGTVKYVNEKYASMKGLDREALLGTDIYEWLDDETAARANAIRAELDAGDRDVGTLEYEFRTADGGTIPAELRFTSLTDAGGEIERVGVVRDVSERRRSRRIRRELLSTASDLMDADSRDEIARIVSSAAVSILDHGTNVVSLRSDGADVPLEPAAWAGGGRSGDRPPTPPEEGPAVTALRDGTPVVEEDVPVTAGDGAGTTTGSVLALPLGDHGVLTVDATDPDAFGEAEIDRARLLTTNAARALDRTARRIELERYETLFETVQDKLYVVDADGDIEMISDPLAAAAGYDPGTLRGEHVSAIATEETVANGEALIADLLAAPGDESDTYEGTLLDADGGRTPVEIELSLLPFEDEFRGTVGAVRDISERRQREEELRVFRQAISEAGIGLAMYGDDGRFERVNDRFARLFGRAPDDLESTPMWAAFEGVDRRGFVSYWESFATDETRTWETDLVRVDRSTVPVETVTTAVEIDGTRHHLVTVREVTGRRQRRQQSEVLHRLIRHNLRNDLTVVLGHASHLADELDGDAADSAETIEETAEALQGLADTARDAQEIIGRETVRRPIDVADVLRREVETLREEFDVSVVTDLPASATVLADAPLRLAVRHLLTNAVQHADAATPWLAVRTARTEDREGWLTVEIVDDGPGIPEHEISVLTAGEETSLHHGSGIGLWIVHWVVTRYGGELEFEERAEGGSVVRVKLPAAAPPDERVESAVDDPCGEPG